MKKQALFFLFLVFLGWFSSVNAFQSFSWDDVKITQEVVWDIYVVASKLTIDAPIKWDVIFLWWELDVNDKVEWDINAIAWKIFFHGDVWDDVRALWWEIHVTKSIRWDALLAGDTVVFDDSSLIAGSIVIYGWSIKNAATVSWDMKISWWNFDFDGTVFGDAFLDISENIQATKESRIRWNLVYTSPKKNDELESWTSWKRDFSYIQPKVFQPSTQLWFTFSVLYSFLFLFWFWVVFYFFFEKFFWKVQLELRTAPLQSFLLGIGLYIGLPIISFILLITIVWIPFWILGFILFAFVFVLAKLTVVVTLSSYLIHKLWGQKNIYFLKKVGIIAVLSVIFALIPLVHFLISIFVYGAILTQKWQILKTLR